MTRFRPVRALLAAAFVAVPLLAGCTAKVSSTVEVTDARAASLRVQAQFTGEAAEVLANDPTARAELVSLVEHRTGRRPQVEVSGTRVVVSAAVDYAQVPQLADITGLAGLTMDGEDPVTVRAELVPADRLAAAITAQASGQPDGPALARTLLEATTVQTRIVFPGTVADAAVDGPGDLDRDDRTVTVARAVADEPATVTVTGTLDDGLPAWLVGAAVGAALLAVVFAARRR